MTGALAPGSVVAAMSVAAAAFLAVVGQVLAPALREQPDDAIVVMDDLPAREGKAVRDALNRTGLHHRYLPPSSPDLDLIEQAWSKLKARLRAGGVRSREALVAAPGPALAAINARDARRWFCRCGYGPAN